MDAEAIVKALYPCARVIGGVRGGNELWRVENHDRNIPRREKPLGRWSKTRAEAWSSALERLNESESRRRREHDQG